MDCVIELIENYLCDQCDALFEGDGLVCDKVYNPEQTANRAAFVTQVLTPSTDQSGVGQYMAQIIENRTKRSECIVDSDIIRRNFIKYGGRLQNGLAIYVQLQYITTPTTKMVVDTSTVYFISAILKITVK
jgi:ATP-dependent protease ClpP protease subunit